MSLRDIEYIDEKVENVISSMILDGKINPYIRNSPIPPMHINLNYLFNPIDMINELKIKNKFDDGNAGFYSKRADPLILPEVARLPFDPN